MEKFPGISLMLILCVLAVISYYSKNIIVSFISFLLFLGVCTYVIFN